MIHKKIYHGFVIRIILTLIFFIFLKKLEKIPIIAKYLYLLLFVGLTFLDIMDISYLVNVNNIFNLPKLLEKSNTNNKYYQIPDKIIDILSYIILILIFYVDNNLIFLVLYRFIGVLLYYKTNDKKFLVIFFDFVKEYLLYLFVFGNNFSYLYIFVVAKIIFEYGLYLRTKVKNSNNYKIKINI